MGIQKIDELQIVFRARLLELMRTKNLTVTELAKAAGLPRTSISNWVHLKRNPQMDALCILGDFFECSVDFLLGRTIDW
jgi:transcriptional regulator with XRE-family HTH domain